ncbi:cardiolipin synthase [Mesoplasma melaleucae]|uniref:Cardiolipin synthase n=1 Tax=Mesoplasma melaleucae TaxID=81459 RepID=A0A2K8NXQ1_9MOLU|nr:cardiolipin synthase [Mesoplasma melaleucae]ATZ18326.1 cardiolipin synthetase [Mesoplasma melaleucae]
MKKPFIATASLIAIYSIGAILYVAINLSLNNFISNPLPFIFFISITHLASIVWAIIVLCNKKRRIETRIRWALFISLIPFFGIVAYAFLVRVYKYKRNANYLYNKDTVSVLQNKTQFNLKLIEKENPEFKRSFMMTYEKQRESIYSNTDIQYLESANTYFMNLLNDINNAKDYILINCYIIADGEFLEKLTELLIRKMEEGIRVYIIYDFLGCYGRFRKNKKRLISEGANLLAYSPIYFPFVKWNANYRDHRKDISIDGKIGYIGGINLADEYISKSCDFGLWNDAAIRLVGEAVQEIELIFKKDWNFYIGKKHKKIEKLEPTVGVETGNRVVSSDFIQIVSDGPNHQSPICLELLLNLIHSAQNRIWLKSPYFIPPPEIINALCNAASTGLDVRILLPGKSDKFLLLEVSKHWTKKMFEHGVKIYSMHNTFIHEKSYVFDNAISFTGSSNLDYRALFSDQQTMALIKSQKTNYEISKKMISDMKYSLEYKFVPNKDLPWAKRMVVKAYNVMAPLL